MFKRELMLDLIWLIFWPIAGFLVGVAAGVYLQQKADHSMRNDVDE